MGIEIKKVTDQRDLGCFIHLPEKLHKGHKNWLPPLYIDEKNFYNPKKNSCFNHSDTILALAFKDGLPVGRIMGIINHRYNSAHGEKNARFFNIECENDPEISKALFTFIESWAKERGMVKLVGPLGFSEKDPQGLMVEGFDQPIVLATASNHEYMVKLIEQEGFRKEVDCVVYQLKIPEEIPHFYEEVKKRTLERNNIRMLEFTRRSELRPLIKPVFHLVNETYDHIFGFSKMTSDEIDFLARRYLPVVNPRFVKIVVNNSGQVVGFLLAIPDIAEGIRLAKGRLFPFGLFKIYRSAKKTKLLVMMLGAIKQEYRNYGLDALMGVQLLKEAKKWGMEMIDSHLVLEDNVKMRAEYERIGGSVYKRYRIFHKSLTEK
jgi:GNAT superfamily N-acetyltransferase